MIDFIASSIKVSSILPCSRPTAIDTRCLDSELEPNRRRQSHANKAIFSIHATHTLVLSSANFFIGSRFGLPSPPTGGICAFTILVSRRFGANAIKISRPFVTSKASFILLDNSDPFIASNCCLRIALIRH